MKRVVPALKRLALGLLIVGSSFSAVPWAFAQGGGEEQEPNNTCSAAQDLGAVGLPFIFSGKLDSTPAFPDVDFFKFEATPHTTLKVNLDGLEAGKGTLEDPFLGLFDSQCNLLTFNDDSADVNSQLIFTVPTDGVFILAATACCDSDFFGGGNGTYQVTMASFEVVGTISGRIIDKVSGEPLSGVASPFASVSLYRCDELDCLWVNVQSTDNQGQFQFNADDSGQPLRTGTYQLLVYGDEYELAETDAFELDEGEALEIGDILLKPFPVGFADIQPCEDLPSRGGVCRYSVKLTNRSGTALKGAAWSVVDGSEIGSLANFTLFQAGRLKKVMLEPGESKVVRFKFKVPKRAADGAYICTQVFFGKGRRNLTFKTVGNTSLFCLSKGVEDFEFRDFSVLSGGEIQGRQHRQRKAPRKLHRQQRQPLLIPRREAQ